jgi:hypothetical protein
MSTNQQNKEEEVDLGSLFIIIGNGFKKFFNFIGRIFTGIFHFFISILLFLKENVIKLSIATIIGAGVGVYFETQKEDVFGSDLLVQPNFNSARQLYDNVNYYNELVEQEEIDSIASAFGISLEEAKSIRRFEVEPVKSENDILTLYDELILSIDTLTTSLTEKSYAYNRFKSEFTDFDYKVHKVHVEATNNKVFGKLGDVIISSIAKNEYLNRIRKLTTNNLYRTDSIVKQNLTQIDSLRQVYMTVLLEEAKKTNSGTNINLGSQSSTIVKELELFKTNKTLYYELKRIADEISEKSEVINVISNFQPVGYQIGGLSNNSIVLFGILGFIGIVGIILLFRLNTFLENYKSK